MGNIDPRTRIRKIDPRRQNGPEHCEHGNTKKSKNFYLPKGASCTGLAAQGDAQAGPAGRYGKEACPEQGGLQAEAADCHLITQRKKAQTLAAGPAPMEDPCGSVFLRPSLGIASRGLRTTQMKVLEIMWYPLSPLDS